MRYRKRTALVAGAVVLALGVLGAGPAAAGGSSGLPGAAVTSAGVGGAGTGLSTAVSRNAGATHAAHRSAHAVRRTSRPTTSHVTGGITAARQSRVEGAGRTRPPVPGAQRFAGGWAVPMSTRGPSWYDLRFFRRVMAAGANGVRPPSGARLPTAVGLAYPGIRPGQWLVTVTTRPVGFAWCTANFVFVKSGTYGLGTAGHCAAKDALGGYPDVTAYVVPPPTSGKLPGFYHIGQFVLSHNNGIGDDFAMIRIYPRYRSWVSPTMPVWGGPTGVYRSTTPTLVKHFGHGAAVGTGGTPRAGLCPILDARNGTAFAWYGVGAPGDSGSGVEATLGPAVGNFTHIVILDGKILPGMLAGTKMTKILRIAAGWTLKRGSLLPV